MTERPLFVPSPTPAIDVERIMLDHTITSVEIIPYTDKAPVVHCKCAGKFDAGDAYTRHLFGVLRDSAASTTELTNTVRSLAQRGTFESTQDDFDQALRVGRFAADDIAIGFTGTPAQRTGALVKRALGALLAQGMIMLTPRDTWPSWHDIDQRHPFEEEAAR